VDAVRIGIKKKKFPHGRDKDGEQILDKQLIPK
jgi:hypothetical protein